jgi:hypothetical protein
MDAQSEGEDGQCRSLQGTVRVAQGCHLQLATDAGNHQRNAAALAGRSLWNPASPTSSQEARQESFRPYLSAIQNGPLYAALRGEPLRVHGQGTQTRCFCLVHDTVEALLRLQRCPAARGSVFNVGSTEEVTILDLAERVIRACRSTSTIEFVPYADAYAAGFEDMLRRRPVVDKLEEAVGFRPRTTLDEIIALTVKTFAESEAPSAR